MVPENFKVVSGGQTGADRASLDWAMHRAIPHRGWCPRGRLAEDGRINARYQVEQTPTADYSQRTEWNVRDSDGTVIFSIARKLTGGSKKTLLLALKHGKPVLHISRKGVTCPPEEELRLCVEENKIQILNVAGPRASEEPEVGGFVQEVLEKAFG